MRLDSQNHSLLMLMTMDQKNKSGITGASVSPSEPNGALCALRSEIDEIDAELCQLIAERYDVCREIAEQKRRAGLPIEDIDRERTVLEKCAGSFPEYSVMLEAVFREILKGSKQLQRSERNLYLIGMPNCGKTKLSVKIGQALGRTHVDTDTLIMNRAGRSIDEIFDSEGEAAFRSLEHDMLRELAFMGGMIVATGGGVLTNEKNIPIIKNSGMVVFLDRSIDKLLTARVKNRPLIRGGAQDVLRLCRERRDVYLSTADLTVDPDDPGAVQRILELYIDAARF